MKKNMICIECPKSCRLIVDIEDRRVVKVQGARCPKGVMYAATEAENPTRILTATIIADGLSIKLIPVRTDKPIPKTEILRAAAEISRIRVSKPVRVSDTIVDNFLGLGVKLIATRQADKL